MSIIYSYPTFGTANGSDLLLASRFDNEPGGPARTINLSLDTIGSYISTNHASTLNQVLTAGNESLLDAKVGGIYLYNVNVPSGSGYVYITGDKNRFNFYNNADVNYGHIAQNSLSFKDPSTPWQFIINTPSGIAANRTATFQNTSGIIAYLSDIPTYGLATLTTNCIPVSNTATELTLLNGTIIGTLTLPENSLVVGDSFKLSLGGLINTVSPTQLFISIKTAAGTILGETGAITIASTCTGKKWSLEATLIIRAIGAATLGTSASSGIFSFKEDSISSISGTTFASVNSSTFDTTIENSLVVTARWATAIPGNLIYTQTFTLNKVY